MQLTLVYLHKYDDRLFLREFFTHYREIPGKSVLIYGPDRTDATPEQVRFLGKRISAHLSEELVTNISLNGDQRRILVADPSEASGSTFQFHPARLESLFQTMDCVVLSALAQDSGGETVVAPVETLLQLCRNNWSSAPLVLFPDNPMTPMTQQPCPIHHEQAYNDLMKVYAEESRTLDLALALRPSIVLAPRQLGTAFTSPEADLP